MIRPTVAPTTIFQSGLFLFSPTTPLVYPEELARLDTVYLPTRERENNQTLSIIMFIFPFLPQFSVYGHIMLKTPVLV
jgi:hypothetical protein